MAKPPWMCFCFFDSIAHRHKDPVTGVRERWVALMGQAITDGNVIHNLLLQIPDGEPQLRTAAHVQYCMLPAAG